jgi:hypothetical protein
VAYPDGRTVKFVHLLHMVRAGAFWEVSKGGDSGALVLARGTTRVVGLHIAGEPEDSPFDYALAVPIRRVLDRLKVSFL